jgi:hypothetical protein
MHDLYNLKDMLCKELEQYGKSKDVTTSSLDVIDKLAHAAKNVGKVIECCEEEEYSNRGSMRGSYRDGGYSRDGFVSRDGSEMAHRLRDMADNADDERMKREIERLADKMESM